MSRLVNMNIVFCLPVGLYQILRSNNCKICIFLILLLGLKLHVNSPSVACREVKYGDGTVFSSTLVYVNVIVAIIET